jgi:hypothetical protein
MSEGILMILQTQNQTEMLPVYNVEKAGAVVFDRLHDKYVQDSLQSQAHAPPGVHDHPS